MAKQPVVLIIRDGWGESPAGQEAAEQEGNAALLAKTPYHDEVLSKCPSSLLSASGGDVGLPDGQMGNSEVGHLNLGAGRIIYQDLTRINKCIADGELAENPSLTEAFSKAKGSRLHLLGLVSDGGVHSHQDHLIALADVAKAAGCEDIMVHAITDGRDTSPTGGKGYLASVEKGLENSGAKIATVIGRYFAMDRDQRWDRNQLAWDAIVEGKGEFSELTPSEAVAARYEQDERDEFIQPIIFSHADERRIRDGDVVIFFNFRSDRARQLSRAFLYDDFSEFETHGRPKVHYLTMTEYDETYDCAVAFPPERYPKVLGEVVSAAGKTQLRIAETEKYPHVTYFFNGGEEEPFEGEDRVIVPSPKVATYDLQPEMNAPQVTDKVVAAVENYDLVIINFANPDMVGHTGDVQAAITAVESIDAGVKALSERVLELGGQLLITADHGNCEKMRNPDGSPHTAHTTNLVRCYYHAKDTSGIEMHNGILADIAPTLLKMLGIEQGPEMTGKPLY